MDPRLPGAGALSGYEQADSNDVAPGLSMNVSRWPLESENTALVVKTARAPR